MVYATYIWYRVHVEQSTYGTEYIWYRVYMVHSTCGTWYIWYIEFIAPMKYGVVHSTYGT